MSQIDENYVGEPPKVQITFENLNDNSGEDFLRDMIAECGTVEQLEIKYHSQTKQHLGLAHVVFADERASKKCVDRWDGKTVMGSVLRVTFDALGKRCQERCYEIEHGGKCKEEEFEAVSPGQLELRAPTPPPPPALTNWKPPPPPEPNPSASALPPMSASLAAAIASPASQPPSTPPTSAPGTPGTRGSLQNRLHDMVLKGRGPFAFMQPEWNDGDEEPPPSSEDGLSAADATENGGAKPIIGGGDVPLCEISDLSPSENLQAVDAPSSSMSEKEQDMLLKQYIMAQYMTLGFHGKMPDPSVLMQAEDPCAQFVELSIGHVGEWYNSLALPWRLSNGDLVPAEVLADWQQQYSVLQYDEEQARRHTRNAVLDDLKAQLTRDIGKMMYEQCMFRRFDEWYKLKNAENEKRRRHREDERKQFEKENKPPVIDISRKLAALNQNKSGDLSEEQLASFGLGSTLRAAMPKITSARKRYIRPGTALRRHRSLSRSSSKTSTTSPVESASVSSASSRSSSPGAGTIYSAY